MGDDLDDFLSELGLKGDAPPPPATSSSAKDEDPNEFLDWLNTPASSSVTTTQPPKPIAVETAVVDDFAPAAGAAPADEFVSATPAEHDAVVDDFAVSAPAESSVAVEDFAVPAPAEIRATDDDFAVSAPAENHSTEDDFAAFTPAENNTVVDDFVVSAPAESSADDFAVSHPAEDSPNDIATSAPAENSAAVDEFAVSAPAEDFVDASAPAVNEDFAVSAPAENIADSEDFAAAPAEESSAVVDDFAAVSAPAEVSADDFGMTAPNEDKTIEDDFAFAAPAPAEDTPIPDVALNTAEADDFVAATSDASNAEHDDFVVAAVEQDQGRPDQDPIAEEALSEQPGLAKSSFENFVDDAFAASPEDLPSTEQPTEPAKPAYESAFADEHTNPNDVSVMSEVATPPTLAPLPLPSLEETLTPMKPPVFEEPPAPQDSSFMDEWTAPIDMPAPHTVGTSQDEQAEPRFEDKEDQTEDVHNNKVPETSEPEPDFTFEAQPPAQEQHTQQQGEHDFAVDEIGSDSREANDFLPVQQNSEEATDAFAYAGQPSSTATDHVDEHVDVAEPVQQQLEEHADVFEFHASEPAFDAPVVTDGHEQDQAEPATEQVEENSHAFSFPSEPVEQPIIFEAPVPGAFLDGNEMETEYAGQDAIPIESSNQQADEQHDVFEFESSAPKSDSDEPAHDAAADEYAKVDDFVVDSAARQAANIDYGMPVKETVAEEESQTFQFESFPSQDHHVQQAQFTTGEDDFEFHHGEQQQDISAPAVESHPQENDAFDYSVDQDVKQEEFQFSSAQDLKPEAQQADFNFSTSSFPAEDVRPVDEEPAMADDEMPRQPSENELGQVYPGQGEVINTNSEDMDFAFDGSAVEALEQASPEEVPTARKIDFSLDVSRDNNDASNYAPTAPTPAAGASMLSPTFRPVPPAERFALWSAALKAFERLDDNNEDEEDEEDETADHTVCPAALQVLESIATVKFQGVRLVWALRRVWGGALSETGIGFAKPDSIMTERCGSLLRALFGYHDPELALHLDSLTQDSMYSWSRSALLFGLYAGPDPILELWDLGIVKVSPGFETPQAGSMFFAFGLCTARRAQLMSCRDWEDLQACLRDMNAWIRQAHEDASNWAIYASRIARETPRTFRNLLSQVELDLHALDSFPIHEEKPFHEATAVQHHDDGQHHALQQEFGFEIDDTSSQAEVQSQRRGSVGSTSKESIKSENANKLETAMPKLFDGFQKQTSSSSSWFKLKEMASKTAKQLQDKLAGPIDGPEHPPKPAVQQTHRHIRLVTLDQNHLGCKLSLTKSGLMCVGFPETGAGKAMQDAGVRVGDLIHAINGATVLLLPPATAELVAQKQERPLYVTIGSSVPDSRELNSDRMKESKRMLHKALSEYYSRHGPSKVDRVEEILELYAGRERALLNGLLDKYGEFVPGDETLRCDICATVTAEDVVDCLEHPDDKDHLLVDIRDIMERADTGYFASCVLFGHADVMDRIRDAKRTFLIGSGRSRELSIADPLRSKVEAKMDADRTRAIVDKLWKAGVKRVALVAGGFSQVSKEIQAREADVLVISQGSGQDFKLLDTYMNLNLDDPMSVANFLIWHCAGTKQQKRRSSSTSSDPDAKQSAAPVGVSSSKQSPFELATEEDEDADFLPAAPAAVAAPKPIAPTLTSAQASASAKAATAAAAEAAAKSTAAAAAMASSAWKQWVAPALNKRKQGEQ